MFWSGMKPYLGLKVRKSSSGTDDDGGRMALNVDSSLFGVGMFSRQSKYFGRQRLCIEHFQCIPLNYKSS